MYLLKITICRLCILGALITFITSCMSVPNLGQNAAFMPEIEVDKTMSHALKTPYFRQGCWPTLNWWEAFNDDHLVCLIEEAIENNPSIQSVQQKVAVAKELMIKQRASLFPSIDFNGYERYVYQSQNSFDYFLEPTLPRTFNHIGLNFSFNYEFDFWGKYTNLFRAARGREQAQKAELKQTELIVSVAIAQAYFALKTNLATKRLLQKLYDLHKKSLSLSNRLFDKAIYSKILPATYKQKLDEIEKSIVTLDSDIAVGKHLVNILRGQGPDESFEITDLLEEMPNEIELPRDLSSDILCRRPDLLAAIWRVEALAYDANAAVADFFPRVNLLGLIGLESAFGYKPLMNWQSGGMGLLPSFHIPIFKAGEIKANLRMKRAELDGAIYDYNKLLLKALQEVTDYIALTTCWYEKKKFQTNIIKEAELKVYLTNLRSKRGIDNLLQVYLEEIDRIQKEIEDIQITYNQYISVINLIKSLGGGYTSEDLRRLKIQGIQ